MNAHYSTWENESTPPNPYEISLYDFRQVLSEFNIPLVITNLFCAGFIHYLEGSPVIVVNKRLDDRYRTFYGMTLLWYHLVTRAQIPKIYLADLDTDDLFMVLAAASLIPKPEMCNHLIHQTTRGTHIIDDPLLLFRCHTYEKMFDSKFLFNSIANRIANF